MSVKNKGGRPLKPIDWKVVEAMLNGGATGTDIAHLLAMSKDHFYRRVRLEKGMLLSTWQTRCRALRNHRLRMAQIQSALGYDEETVENEYKVMPDGSRVLFRQIVTKIHHPPNAAMLIFLGKNMLGQSDKPELVDDNGSFGNIPHYRMIGDSDNDGEIIQLESGNNDELVDE